MRDLSLSMIRTHSEQILPYRVRKLVRFSLKLQLLLFQVTHHLERNISYLQRHFLHLYLANNVEYCRFL